MDIDNVRELKEKARRQIVNPLATRGVATRALAVAATERSDRVMVRTQRTLALGVARAPRGQGYRLAVRVQRQSLADGTELDRLHRMAAGEIDVRFVGRVAKRAGPWHQKAQRPLLIGSSIGHFRITAGTLGAFVRARGAAAAQALFVLSNNHVLANENRARKGDRIVQPGPLDADGAALSRVAALERFVRLKTDRANLVDAAIARVDAGITTDLRRLRGLGGRLAGLSSQPLDEGLSVHKVGRTTGVTHGRVTAFELDDVVVDFDAGNLSFDDQIEIEGAGTHGFSDGGDSGSLIVDDDFGAVALLFAGSEVGGSNGKGLTYANPIATVLDALKVDFAVAG
jgi:hypothetical protein